MCVVSSATDGQDENGWHFENIGYVFFQNYSVSTFFFLKNHIKLIMLCSPLFLPLSALHFMYKRWYTVFRISAQFWIQGPVSQKSRKLTGPELKISMAISPFNAKWVEINKPHFSDRVLWLFRSLHPSLPWGTTVIK